MIAVETKTSDMAGYITGPTEVFVDSHIWQYAVDNPETFGITQTAKQKAARFPKATIHRLCEDCGPTGDCWVATQFNAEQEK